MREWQLDVEVWDGVMRVKHGPRDPDCGVEGWHRYEQCGLHPNADVRIVVGVDRARKEER